MRTEEGGSFARVIFFLVWPFGSLAFTAYHLRSSWAKNIVWLFVIFFGLTFVISNPKIDANRYNDKLQEMGIMIIHFRPLAISCTAILSMWMCCSLY